MTIYKRHHDGVMMVPVRTEHRMDLRALTLALYHSNEELGAELSVRAVRKAVADELACHGSELITRVADYIHEAEEYDEGSLVGRAVVARLEWARRMVVKAYGPEFERYPEALAALHAFEALTPKAIV
ncbi:hypothetical protein [Streptomyces sp. MH60]|uniref:hypothetical protein n=1 Tax=Streptomyces sp. MH60 TaxID=1940758 RepID=UPI000CEDD435|nr:hypothetical protein [Streptomyces sp. MH60]PPS89580.1 hypothetical protein BZZ08_01727 [Streptomyces sp. MH60]